MKRNDILIILTIILIGVIVWVIFNVYQAGNASKLSGSVNEEVIPIKPDFDQTVIESSKLRTHIDPVYEMAGDATSDSARLTLTPASPLPKPSVKITPAKNATTSAL